MGTTNVQLENRLDQIRTVWPTLDWTSSRFVDTGWDHDVVILDERLVVRFPKHRAPQDFRQEVELLRLLAQRATLPTPADVFVADDTFAV